ncbi:MAG TPA: phage Gp37/Gp68 family protein [Chloroflexota bacterium]|nr:phage Gp37/Gp68 family protein [Chloroflexota bacterium]
MSARTAIEWATASWNPLRGTLGRHYCIKLSPGCDHCYASTMNRRLSRLAYPAAADVMIQDGQILAKQVGVVTDRVRLDRRVLAEPIRWRQPRRVFVCSMTDLFGEWVPDAWIAEVFGVMAATPHHTYMVLTKRPHRMARFVDALYSERFEWEHYIRAWVESAEGDERDDLEMHDFFSHVWLGVTVESDAYAWRAKVLAEIPAAVRWVSAEPLLGPLPSLDLSRVNWVVVGGESGGPPARRLIEPIGDPGPDRLRSMTFPTKWQPKAEALAWVRDLRDRAQAAGTAFFFKQWGGPHPKSGGRLLDRRAWDEYPTPRQAVAV